MSATFAKVHYRIGESRGTIVVICEPGEGAMARSSSARVPSLRAAPAADL